MSIETAPLSREDEIKAELARIALVKKWPTRLKKLRENKDLKESEFCDKHEIPRTSFNRMKSLRVIVSKENLEKVEAAFRAEGV